MEGSKEVGGDGQGRTAAEVGLVAATGLRKASPFFRGVARLEEVEEWRGGQASKRVR